MRTKQIQPNTVRMPLKKDKEDSHCKHDCKKRQNIKTLFFGKTGEPKYDGYQIWCHDDIPNYNDDTKNIINQNFSIKNYLF